MAETVPETQTKEKQKLINKSNCKQDVVYDQTAIGQLIIVNILTTWRNEY